MASSTSSSRRDRSTPAWSIDHHSSWVPHDEGKSMRLESVRELKTSLAATILGPTMPELSFRLASMPAVPIAEVAGSPPAIALGVAVKGRGDYGLAVRVQRRGLESGPQVEAIRRQAKGEVDLRYIGKVS